MKTLGYYNGRIEELEAMTVPMLDRACYFGDGVYDVTYSRNYRIYALDEHIDHFFESASLIQIVPHFSKQKLKEILLSLVQKMDSGDLWVYFQFSRGTALRNHAFPENATPNLWIMLKPGTIRDTYRPMRCITMADTRHAHCNVKSLNLLANVLATEATVQAGADECILHREGVVTECAHSNISILRDGVLYTHPADAYILAGTGRAHLLAQCRRMGMTVVERTYTMEELMAADEVLVTSASALCMRVVEVAGNAVGGKAPHTVKSLQDALLEEYLRETE